MECSEKLNKAVQCHDPSITISSEEMDGQEYAYDLNYMKRKATKQNGSQKGNHHVQEDIIQIQGVRSSLALSSLQHPHYAVKHVTYLCVPYILAYKSTRL
jgi:hypothetical protein